MLRLPPYSMVRKVKCCERPGLHGFPTLQLYSPFLRAPADITCSCIPGVQVAMESSQELLVSPRVLSECEALVHIRVHEEIMAGFSGGQQCPVPKSVRG